MTDRAALADRFESLAKKATPKSWVSDWDINGRPQTPCVTLFGDDAKLAEAFFRNLPTILAALRDPGFAAGAEAMREAAAAVKDIWWYHSDGSGGIPDSYRMEAAYRRAIRALPLPEPKP